MLFTQSCSKVPITGRRQLNIVPASTLNSMSFEQYDQFLAEHELSDNLEQTAMVEEVGDRTRRAVENFMHEQGQSDKLAGYEWEFHLVKSDEVNAWCMPGGKVVVYEGIMPVARDEAGLAVVMSHEIAHAVAQHGNERMSQGLLTELGGMALEKALEEKPQQTQQLFMTAFGVGAQVGILLPYSRLQESEADHLGVIFMAMAGYDPHAAINFWERMSNQGGAAPPEFLSTHPSDERRIRQIRDLMPEAMKYYQPAGE